MKFIISISSLCLLFTITSSKPLAGLLQDDSELVGSNLNKVYAPAPIEDLQAAGTGHKHGSGHHDVDDDTGYYTSKSTKGDNGYKHFDSYHKKDGDKYAYEAHSAYGKSKKGKDGKSHHTSGKYHEVDGDDGGSHAEYYDGEGTEIHYGKQKKNQKAKDHKGAATDGDYSYEHYESDGEGDDSGHFSEGGDEGHYEEDGGHYSEGSEEGDSEGYYEGEGDSGSYYDGEGETRQRGVIHHGGPSGKATSYSVRHF